MRPAPVHVDPAAPAKPRVVASMASRWGAYVARRRWWALGAWAVLVVVMAFFVAGTARLLSPAGFDTDTSATYASNLLRQHFPERRGPALFAAFESGTVSAADPAYAAQVAAWRSDLQRLVAGQDAVVPPPLLGRDGRTAAVLVNSSLTPDHFIDLAARARQIHHSGPAAVYLGGLGPVYDTFLRDSEADLQASERASVPLAVVLLLVVFGGVVAAGLPAATGLASVTVAVALLGMVARLHTVSVFSLNVSSVVGLGLGIDYSLLVVNRFREELRAGLAVEEAVAATMGTAGVATVVSGGTVMIGFGALMLSRLNVLWSIGLGGALVVAVSVLASLTLIPALLAVFGSRVDSLALPFTRGRNTERFWHRLAAGVMRRPAVFIAGTLALVLLLAWPARNLHPGVVGAESLPPSDATAVAQRIAQGQIGLPSGSPILVVVTGVPDLAAATRLEGLVRTAAGRQPVVGAPDVPPPQRRLYLAPPYAVFDITQPGPDNDSATHAFLDRLRAISWPSGVSAQLGGEAAAYQDFLNVLGADFPRVFGVVIVLTLLLLGLSFRSIALPLKAVLMNLLSIGAAMGVLTFVFQEGHFASQLDFRAVGFIDATVPVIIFAALFGLSMDYEVFLLSRIREEHLAGRDNRAAVAYGMERTGQIITSAALIMVAVISTLAFAQLSLDKAIGVTFAVAVLLDATVIRLILVPAMMRVLGDLNWWPDRGFRGWRRSSAPGGRP